MKSDFIAGDTGSKLVATCKDDATKLPISLTGATVSLRYSIAGGVVQSRSMVITNAAGGVAEYLFSANELTEGVIVGQVKVTDALGRIVSQLEPFAKKIGQSL